MHAKQFKDFNKLVLRECVRGGKVEAFLGYYHPALFKGCEMKYIDVNSLYPYVVLQFGLPAGMLKWIRGPDIKRHVQTKAFQFYYKNCRFHGALHVKVWVNPKRVLTTPLYPFLPLRYKEKVLCVLCRTCMELQNNRPCTHTSVQERSWTAHYTTVDLEYALYMGYEILEIYEILAHFQLSTSLQKHFQFLAGKKCTTSFPTTAIKEGEMHKCEEKCKTNDCEYLTQYVSKINERKKISRGS